MFVDFYKKNEDMDQVSLMHKRRIIKSKLAKAVYRPKTEIQLLEKFNDEDYVKLIMADAVRRNRVEKDRLAPNDLNLRRFWVLDDETLEFSNAQELEFALECQAELTNGEAQELTADGGFFAAGGEVGTGGINPCESARLHDFHSHHMTSPSETLAITDGQVDANDPKAKAAAKKEALKAAKLAKDAEQQKAADAAKEAGLPPPPLTKDTGLEKARKTNNELCSCVATATRVILDLNGADGAKSHQDNIQRCIDAMKQQIEVLGDRISLAILEPVDYYDSMVENAAAQIKFYKNRALYAKSLINVTKRIQNAAPTTGDEVPK